MPELSTENILNMMDHNLDVTAHLLTIKRISSPQVSLPRRTTMLCSNQSLRICHLPAETPLPTFAAQRCSTVAKYNHAGGSVP
jgi:hypothetical protein